MTSGSFTVGTVGNGHYLKRSWSGQDYPLPGEHAYWTDRQESDFIPVQHSLNGGLRWLSGNMYNFFPVGSLLPPSSDISVARNKATSDAMSKITQSNFNMGVFGGEFRETVDMFSGVFRAFAGVTRLARKGNIAGALQSLAHAVNRYSKRSLDPNAGMFATPYLGMKFGVLPLLHDIEDGYELIRSNYKRLSYVKGRCVIPDNSAVTFNHVTWQMDRKTVCEVRGYCDMVEVSAYDRLGLGSPEDVVAAIYALTRLSFVVDWALPITNFLEALSASNKTQGNDFFETIYSVGYGHSPEKDANILIVPFQADAYMKKIGTCRRTKLSSLPWSFPVIQDPFAGHMDRYLTSVALLRQFTR